MKWQAWSTSEGAFALNPMLGPILNPTTPNP